MAANGTCNRSVRSRISTSIARRYSYEQAFDAMRRLGLPHQNIEQLFLRMVFNIVARNQDDHVKNIAFLMDRAGVWSLAPAFDMTYAYRPSSRWTGQHQMSMNGKRDDFTLADFDAAGRVAALPQGRARRMVHDVVDVVSQWDAYADRVNVDEGCIWGSPRRSGCNSGRRRTGRSEGGIDRRGAADGSPPSPLPAPATEPRACCGADGSGARPTGQSETADTRTAGRAEPCDTASPSWRTTDCRARNSGSLKLTCASRRRLL